MCATTGAGHLVPRRPWSTPSKATAAETSRRSCRSSDPWNRRRGSSPAASRPADAAATIHRGGYDGLPEARSALTEWIERAGLEPVGPLRVVYLQFGADGVLQVPTAFLAATDSDFVTELQQPVEGDRQAAVRTRIGVDGG